MPQAACIPVVAAYLFLAATAIPQPATAGESIPLLVTVDDLPIALGSIHSEPADRRKITEEMMSALSAHGIRAVGMVTWRNVRDEGDLALLERWIEAGHELGNHSYRHPSFTRTSIEDYLEDLEAARVELQGFLEPRGESLRFFRFPMLREGETMEKLRAARAYLERSGQRNLPVTLDNQDYSFERSWVEAAASGEEAAMRRVADAYHESLHLSVRHHRATSWRLFDREVPQILLLHAGAVGAAQWDRLFTWLEGEGFRFASADEVLADPTFEEPHEFLTHRGYGLWDRILATRALKRARREVDEIIRTQVEAWNGGDLEAFTSVYADEAAFVTPKGITRGRKEVYRRYLGSYPDRAAMGRLSLEVLDAVPIHGTELSMLGDSRPGSVHGITVIARWSLTYPQDQDRDDAEGLTLLVFRRHAGSWEIVQDASM